MSDALTDIARSEAQAKYSSEFADAEMEFLVNPSQETFDRLNEAGGAWLSNTPRFARGRKIEEIRSIEAQYRQRFGDTEDYTIESQDLAYFLRRIKENQRLKRLAGMMTVAEGLSPGEHGYHSAFQENMGYIKERLTVADKEKLEGDFSPGELEDILDTVDFSSVVLHRE